MMNRSRRRKTSGQISMEFIVYMGILLTVFSVFAPMIFTETIRIYNSRQDLVANRIATTLEKEINTAVVFGSGYSRNFTLPEKIVQSDYEVGVTSQARIVRVSWGKSAESRQIITNDVSGEATPGKNRIENVGGQIVFNG